jgi:vacuolar-type H+-ATPase subunit I/STV1
MKNGTAHKFDNLFIKFENGIPQFITNDPEHQFRKLHQHKDKNDVSHRDIDGKRCFICFNQLSKTQNKISETQATIAETQKTIAETESTLAKAILNLTEILKNQQEQERQEPEQDEDE